MMSFADVAPEGNNEENKENKKIKKTVTHKPVLLYCSVFAVLVEAFKVSLSPLIDKHASLLGQFPHCCVRRRRLRT